MKILTLKLAHLITVFLLLLPTACSQADNSVAGSFANPDNTASPQLSLELARSEKERSFGLMYRREMPERSGMLFVFDAEQPQSFWMKNTYLELDIIFLDKNFQVVSIAERAVPLSTDTRKSSGPAQYVIELRGGSAKRWGIVPGSKFESNYAAAVNSNY